MSEEAKRPQKPMNIEEAGNYLKEKQKTLAADMKQEAKEAPISYASPSDRAHFLIYGLSLMRDVSESIKSQWCMITGKPAATYSTKEVSMMLRKLLVLRINGYTINDIAHHLKTTPDIVHKTEQVALRAVEDAINKTKHTGIPILGGVN